MKHNAIVVGIVLLLICPVLAQTVPAPPQQPETTSIDSLIQSVKDLQKEIQNMRQEMQQIKIQLQDSFASNADKMLLYLTSFLLGFYALTRLVSRLYSWLAYRGRKREIDAENAKMMAHVAAVSKQLETFQQSISSMQSCISGMEKQIAELRFHVGIDHPRKRGLIEKIKAFAGWGKSG